MKKLTFYDLFLVFAIMLSIGTKNKIYSDIILLCAGLMELIDVVPKMVRLVKSNGK